jgi:heme exporter protein C
MMQQSAAMLMALAFCMYSIAMALARVRCVILEREQESAWAGAQFRGELKAKPA